MVAVPQIVVNILKDAEMVSEVLTYDSDTGRKVRETIKRRQYPFSNEGPANAEEVAEWRKKNVTILKT